jgi:mannitol 2-dehydrogenase
MVDCITPATGERERAMVRTQFGIEDACPVVCEPFRQWVLEDRFPQGRPALQKVGVQFVEDVAPYELMKLRILNGGHAAIAYPAALMGIQYVHEAMAEPLIRAFLEKLEKEEIIPTVPPVPGVDFQDYLTVIEQRFGNSKVADTIPRLCLDGSNRQPKFILPTIADRLGQGLPVTGLALEVALWCRYCAGTREDGRTVTLVDVNADRLRGHALKARDEPTAFLEIADVFGPLSAHDAFRAAFSTALTSLWETGTSATLTAYVRDGQGTHRTV